MKVIDRLKNIFIKEKKTKSDNTNRDLMDYIYDKTNSPSKDMMSKIDFSQIPDPQIVGNLEADKTIILLDDIPYTEMLYFEDIKKVKNEYNYDVYEKYKIVRCLGPNAGFIAYKYFVLNKNPCHIGILDITLGHRVHVTGGWYMELDGIDIANWISNLNPEFDFVLCTAHTINKENYIVNTYNRKCKKLFNRELDYYYLNKNGERYKKLYNKFVASKG